MLAYSTFISAYLLLYIRYALCIQLSYLRITFCTVSVVAIPLFSYLSPIVFSLEKSYILCFPNFQEVSMWTCRIMQLKDKFPESNEICDHIFINISWLNFYVSWITNKSRKLKIKSNTAQISLGELRKMITEVCVVLESEGHKMIWQLLYSRNGLRFFGIRGMESKECPYLWQK